MIVPPAAGQDLPISPGSPSYAPPSQWYSTVAVLTLYDPNFAKTLVKVGDLIFARPSSSPR